MYKDTVTQNLPFRRRLSVEIGLNQGDMSVTGRRLYRDRLAATLDGTEEQQQQQEATSTTAVTADMVVATTTTTQQTGGQGRCTGEHP